jgi:phenylalanine ammonia-lyase
LHIAIDGANLKIPHVVLVARDLYKVRLSTEREDIRRKVEESHDFFMKKLLEGSSIYGVSTGFGGSGQQTSQLFFFFKHVS